MITPQDKELLAKKGVSEEQIAERLICLEKGFSYLKLFATASVGQGILAPDADEQRKCLDARETYTQTDKAAAKLVPASGAVSRMFKNLLEFLGADYDTPQSGSKKTFFGKIEKSAFYDDLNAACLKTAGEDTPTSLAAGDYKAVITVLLKSAGLNYGALPKGLLKFHKYEDGARTPLEGHLVEGTLYTVNKNGEVNVHFTVSPEHRALFKALADEKAAAYARKYSVDYNISFSKQESSIDIVAADVESRPFRDNGKLLSRPGGHGALTENLNNFNTDITFIKNIGNVVPDKPEGDIILYKKLIAGVLITLQQQAFVYLQLLDNNKYMYEQVLDVLQFVQRKLLCKDLETKNLKDAELVIYPKNKPNRPMCVCGMAENVDEPGGNPSLAYNSNGTVSLQILESSQIDINDPEKRDMFEKGTYFSLVDLARAVRDHKGHKFDLVKYVDKATGFISYKPRNSKDLKTLELPGLRGGAINDQSIVFMEVPPTTLNPVKTVNDLSRE